MLAGINGHLDINLRTPIICDTANADFGFIVTRHPSGNRMALPSDSNAIANLDFIAMPNPSSGILEVTIPTEMFKSDCKLILFDAIGKTILTKSIGASSVQLKLEVPPGVYVLQLQTPSISKFKKIIIQK